MLVAGQTTSVSKHALTFLSLSLFGRQEYGPPTSEYLSTQQHVQLCIYLPIHKNSNSQKKCSKHESNYKHENTSDLFCLPCLLVHGTLHANRMQMHLIESGDAEVIVFGEMSKMFFFIIIGGGFSL